MIRVISTLCTHIVPVGAHTSVREEFRLLANEVTEVADEVRDYVLGLPGVRQVVAEIQTFERTSAAPPPPAPPAPSSPDPVEPAPDAPTE